MSLSPMLVIAALAAPVAVQATEVFQNTDVTLGYTTQSKDDPVFGTGTSDKKLTTLRLEHFGVHGFGDNYFSIDNFHGKNVGNIPAFSAGGFNAGSFADNTKDQYFIVWNARASVAKLSDSKLAFGFVKDVSAMYRMERASYANFHADHFGPSFDLDVPGFAWFQTDFLLRKADYTGATAADKKSSLYWHTFAILPFEVAGAKFTWTPLLNVNFDKGANGTTTIFQPDLWVKFGASPVELGFRAEYSHYKNFSRTSPTLLAKWNF
jgi:nucleoside-specific outer membrane channel protein Tsx